MRKLYTSIAIAVTSAAALMIGSGAAQAGIHLY